MCGSKNVPDTENALCSQGLGKGPVHSALRGADSAGGPDAGCDAACMSVCDLPGLSVSLCECVRDYLRGGPGGGQAQSDSQPWSSQSFCANPAGKCSEVDPAVLDYWFTRKHLELRKGEETLLLLKYCCDISGPLSEEMASCFEGVMCLPSHGLHAPLTPPEG